MKTYEQYKEEALELLKKEHGNNTVEFVTQIRNNLHLVTQSVIMLDFMNKLEESKKEVVLGDETVKTVNRTSKK